MQSTVDTVSNLCNGFSRPRLDFCCEDAKLTQFVGTNHKPCPIGSCGASQKAFSATHLKHELDTTNSSRDRTQGILYLVDPMIHTLDSMRHESTIERAHMI